MFLFLVSCVSTITAAVSNIYLMRLFLLRLSNDVFTAWFSFFNLSSFLVFFLAHFLVFGFTTKCVNLDKNQTLMVFMTKLRTCSLIFFLTNFVILKFLIKYDINVVFLFFFSFSYSFFWVLNAICSTLNKMSRLFLVFILLQILLVSFSRLVSYNGFGINEILLIYGFSYLLTCVTLFKLIFPDKNCLCFIYYFFCKKNSIFIKNSVSWQNLIFDALWLVISVKIFYSKYFFNDISANVAFCLFWRITETGECLLDRVIDSRQGVFVNALQQKVNMFEFLLKSLKICFVLALVGAFFYVGFGKILLKLLFNYDKNFIPQWAWYGGALFYLQYAIVSSITHFVFFINRIGCINKIFFINVTFFLIGLFLLKGTNPFFIPFLSLINIIFIPFYLKCAKKSLDEING